jgi:hypothetical protein
VLDAAHLTWLRPGTGLPPGEEHRLLGRTTLRAVAQGELIGLQDLAP